GLSVVSPHPTRRSSDLALHVDIAKDYYLYRERIKAKTAQAGVTLGALELPAGARKHDEFQGDVEVYHGAVDATLPYTLADAARRSEEHTSELQSRENLV